MMYVTISRDFGFNRGINALFLVLAYYRLHIYQKQFQRVREKIVFPIFLELL